LLQNISNILETPRSTSAKTGLGFEPKISLEEGISAYIPEIIRLYGTDIS
jgi:nucleoside-diphosphate-sugar epimerase